MTTEPPGAITGLRGFDLASEGDRIVLLKLLERADVRIENFKPGTLDKWGIGYSSAEIDALVAKGVVCRTERKR
jgi:crotonobetainyl-CoA:carnitine CoA-transferase CaiB-like acyl-CoA transferase